MVKQVIICVFTIFLYHSLQAQQRYRLIDQQSQDPVPFAHIKLQGSNWGTTSNSDGAWKNIFSHLDTLLISAIGYQTRKIVMASLKSDTVYLQQAYTTLPEIVISQWSAREVVQMAIEAIPQNYALNYIFTGMYFSAIKENNSYVHYLKSKCVVKDSQYLFNRKLNIKKFLPHLSEDYRNYPIDSVTSIGRAFTFDHIKFQKAFINYQNLEDWQISFVGYSKQKQGSLYIIRAKLIAAEDKMNHRISIYINEENFAIEKLEYDYQWRKNYFTRYNDSLKVANKRWQGTFWYEKVDDKYIPYQFHFNHQKDVFSPGLEYLASQYQVAEFYPQLISSNKEVKDTTDLILISSVFDKVEKSLDSLSQLTH